MGKRKSRDKFSTHNLFGLSFRVYVIGFPWSCNTLGTGQKVEGGGGGGGGPEENGEWVSKFRALAKGGSPQFSASGGVGHDSF